MKSRYPFVTLPQAVALLRIACAGLFMAHALVRVANGTVPRFGAFLESKGVPFGVAAVWAITAFELGGGTLLLLKKHVRWCTLGFLALLLGGVVLIHWPLGWFVGEHGTGGMEYSVALAVALLVVAAAEA